MHCESWRNRLNNCFDFIFPFDFIFNVMNDLILGSGKSFTMFGTKNAYGILNRSIELILNKSAPINVSVVEMIGINMYDLCDKTKKLDKTKPKIISMGEIQDFNALVAKVQRSRAQKETDQNLTSSRSHLMFYFSNNQGGKMAFVDLACWENPKNKTLLKSSLLMILCPLLMVPFTWTWIQTNLSLKWSDELCRLFILRSNSFALHFVLYINFS